MRQHLHWWAQAATQDTADYVTRQMINILTSSCLGVCCDELRQRLGKRLIILFTTAMFWHSYEASLVKWWLRFLSQPLNHSVVHKWSTVWWITALSFALSRLPILNRLLNQCLRTFVTILSCAEHSCSFVGHQMIEMWLSTFARPSVDIRRQLLSTLYFSCLQPNDHHLDQCLSLCITILGKQLLSTLLFICVKPNDKPVTGSVCWHLHYHYLVKRWRHP